MTQDFICKIYVHEQKKYYENVMTTNKKSKL